MLFDKPEKLLSSDVLNWHVLCTEALRREKQETILRVATGTPLPLPLSGVFQAGTTLKEIDEYFSSSIEEIDLSVLLFLVAATEARLRKDALNRSKETGNSLSTRLARLYAGAAHAWQVPLYDCGIINEWKLYANSIDTTVLSQLYKSRILNDIGEFKALLDIRHWAAHGRYWQLKRNIKSYPPAMAAKKIQAIIDALNELTKLGGISAVT